MAHIQSIGNHAASAGTTIAATYGSSVGAARFLCCRVVWSPGSTTCTVADNVNGAWTPVGTPVNETNAGRQQLFFKANASAGATTVTATISNSVGYRNIATGEWSGVVTTSPLDANNATTGTGTAPAVSLTTVTNHCLVIGGSGNAQTGAAGSGFNSRVVQDGNVLEDLLDKSPAGAVSVVFTQAPSGGWTAAAAAFKLVTATTDTPTPGVATAAGITPAASIVATAAQGTAPASGASPSAGATATQGVAAVAGVTPTTVTSATPTGGLATAAGVNASHGATLPAGTATAVGVSPSDGSDETTDTPTMGVSTAAGISPSTSLSHVSAAGVAACTGITPVASVTATPTPATATAGGITPHVTVTRSPTPGVAVVSYQAPTTRVTVTPVRGIAVAAGISAGTPAPSTVGLDAPRTAGFVTVGATTAAFESPARLASLERPGTTAAFERPSVAASFEQAESEIVLG